MANVQINKWEVAEMFGLEYLGETEWDGINHTSWYRFSLNDNGVFLIEQNGWDAENEDQAKEKAAGKVLTALGKLIMIVGDKS